MPGRLEKLSARLEARYRVAIVVVAGAVFAAGIAGVVASDGNSVSSKPSTTTSSRAPVTTTASSLPSDVRQGIEGFGPVAFSVLSGDGQRSEHCGLLAETSEQLARGLMGQSDLGGYDAMIFRFPENVESSFYMANVPVPLAIAWFDEDGEFVSSGAMEPCTVEASECPLYSAGAPFRFALETAAGGLDGLGIGDGSSIELGGNCV